MSTENFSRTKKACYFSYLSMSSAFCLPPLLFMTFREMYGISYTLLGTLVLVNFCTQLTVDLIFTFFTKYFNIAKTVRIMPVITTLGLLVYAIFPSVYPQYAYFWLAFGTILFSVSAGLSEVLLSPVIARIPSKTPDKDMSFLHSLYAWGVFGVVIITTAFINIFGAENWMYLTVFFAFLPLIACYLFCTSPIPSMSVSEKQENSTIKNRNTGLMLCVCCIFLGGAAECAMTNWISGYMESALFIPKMYGDIIGMALFAFLLGVGRMFYSKYGKNILKTLMFGMLGAFLCYMIAGFSKNAFFALFACVFSGFCTSMLWPGTLILMEEKIPNPGFAAYALMASGGDLGASVAPQLMGIVIDKVNISDWAYSLGLNLNLQTEQISMKTGMLVAGIFPFIGIILLFIIKGYFFKKRN